MKYVIFFLTFVLANQIVTNAQVPAPNPKSVPDNCHGLTVRDCMKSQPDAGMRDSICDTDNGIKSMNASTYQECLGVVKQLRTVTMERLNGTLPPQPPSTDTPESLRARQWAQQNGVAGNPADEVCIQGPRGGTICQVLPAKSVLDTVLP